MKRRPADPLRPDVLLSAYAAGIFPMDVDGALQWFSPDPRAILPLDAFHVSRTLRQVCRQNRFEIRSDTAFEQTLRGCAARADGTWISPDIQRAYCRLHELGAAHSVEAWRGGRLVGGLYGVALGAAYFGESMFHIERDASKVALVALVEGLIAGRFELLDIQFLTPHLVKFGAAEIPRRTYMQRLAAALGKPARWSVPAPAAAPPKGRLA